MTDRIIIFCSVVLTIFLALIVVGIIKKCVMDTYPPQERQPTEMEKVEINRLFQKHGVWYARVDGIDVWFWQNGRRYKFQ